MYNVCIYILCRCDQKSQNWQFLSINLGKIYYSLRFVLFDLFNSFIVATKRSACFLIMSINFGHLGSSSRMKNWSITSSASSEPIMPIRNEGSGICSVASLETSVAMDLARLSCVLARRFLRAVSSASIHRWYPVFG